MKFIRIKENDAMHQMVFHHEVFMDNAFNYDLIILADIEEANQNLYHELHFDFYLS